MTAWSATHPLIDELLHDDQDYSITFARDIGIPGGPDNETWAKIVYTRYGINDTLEGMAQILVKMSEGDFGIPCIDPVKDELVQLIEDQVRTPGQLKEVQATIARSTERIEQAEDQNDPTVRFAIQALEDSRQLERDLTLRLAMKDGVTKAAQLGVQFVELIDKIIVDTQNSDLDLDAVVPEEMLRMGGVPAEEPRKTVGAFIYYYVNRTAAQPVAKSHEDDTWGRWTVNSPRGYVLIEPVA